MYYVNTIITKTAQWKRLIDKATIAHFWEDFLEENSNDILYGYCKKVVHEMDIFYEWKLESMLAYLNYLLVYSKNHTIHTF